LITDIKASGITTPYAIATELARRGIPTARGHRFVIGWLNVPALGTMERYLEPFKQGLADTGYVVGRESIRLTRWNIGPGAVTLLGIFAIALALTGPGLGVPAISKVRHAAFVNFAVIACGLQSRTIGEGQ
jgi:hypothetical protein